MRWKIVMAVLHQGRGQELELAGEVLVDEEEVHELVSHGLAIRKPSIPSKSDT